MRTQVNSLTRKNSTKSERRFLELLKSQHVSFKSKVRVCGREVDFLIGKYAIDIDGHEQDPTKNSMLISHGYCPVHFNNEDIGDHLAWWINQIKHK